MLRIILFFSLLLFIISCTTSTSEDDSTLRNNYLIEAKRKFPDIEKHAYQLLLGELNNDGIKDAVIEYAYGEGMRPFGKKLLFVLSSKQSIVSTIPFNPTYCPKVDTILNASIIVSEFSDCITGKGEPISTRALQVNNGTIEEIIIWSIQEELIPLLKELETDVIQLELTIFSQKYGFDVAKFSSIIEEDRIIIKNILSHNQLDKLKEEDMISLELEKDKELVIYEVQKLNQEILLTAWYSNIEHPGRGESMVRYRLAFKEGRLTFVAVERAG